MMSTTPKDGKLLYHLTALNNLESIIETELKPRESIDIMNIVDVADHDIINCRKDYDLEKSVPFHFFSKTPFAGSVQKSNQDSEFIFITITRKFAKANGSKIIPTHPLHFQKPPLDWDSGIEAINWDLMAKKDYSLDECKQTCMAESNFNGTIQPKDFFYIFVKSEQTKQKVENLLKLKDLSVLVKLNPDMFVKND